MESFINITGCFLGILIIMYTAFVCAAPIRFFMWIIANSIIGCAVFILADKLFPFITSCPGINPITTVCVGILGIPGAIVLIIMCLL